MKHEELTRKIIGCAMTVHSTLGNGFQEVIYQEGSGYRNEDAGTSFRKRKRNAHILLWIWDWDKKSRFFRWKFNYGRNKAIINLEDDHLAQAMNYLEAYKMEIGLLLNFGARSLEFMRIHNNKCNPYN